jgi:hypothetical protein
MLDCIFSNYPEIRSKSVMLFYSHLLLPIPAAACDLLDTLSISPVNTEASYTNTDYGEACFNCTLNIGYEGFSFAKK